MAQSGYTPILIYASGTTTNVPLAANLTSGASGAELALNYADGKLFYKDASNVVQLLASKASVVTSTTTQVVYNNAGSLVGSANMTFDGTVLTSSFAGPVAATTLSASSTVSGAGFITYLASPPAIGGTSPAAGSFTTLVLTGAAQIPLIAWGSGSATPVSLNYSAQSVSGSTSFTQAGSVNISAGTGGSATGQSGGNVNLYGGTAGTGSASQAGNVSLYGGTGSLNVDGGGAYVYGGSGNSTTATYSGGPAYVQGGFGSIANQAGGSAYFSGGSGYTSGNSNGGNAFISGGAGYGSGTPGSIYFRLGNTPTTVAQFSGFTNNFTIVGATSALGYGAGSGGAVTQLTSRTTSVTLNKANGAITIFSSAGSATAASFTVNNSLVEATDNVVVSVKSGTNVYIANVTAVAAGSFRITFYSTGGTATDSPVFNFAVIKSVAA